MRDSTSTQLRWLRLSLLFALLIAAMFALFIAALPVYYSFSFDQPDIVLALFTVPLFSAIFALIPAIYLIFKWHRARHMTYVLHVVLLMELLLLLVFLIKAGSLHITVMSFFVILSALPFQKQIEKLEETREQAV